MENRGKRATKNHRKYTFLAVFVQFLVRCNWEFIRAKGAVTNHLRGDVIKRRRLRLIVFKCRSRFDIKSVLPIDP